MFILTTLNLLDNELERIGLALSRLSDEQLWHKLKDETNSVGNLCLHLAGNEYHSIVSSIGGEPYVRERSAEFLMENGYTRRELSERLYSVREKSREVLAALSEEDLYREVYVYYPPEAGIASYTRKMMDLLYHVTAHYAYHTGQIVYITRMLQKHNEHLLKWRH
ncbi:MULTISPECIES: DinB family protein [unclassified Paenibacillus]|uniref:DinB family protein n=1 Tax=unclassified Paenibacillus TaxID=185978 RepID=UPI001AE40427|nr:MULTISPECIES: DinB family protein [unclassified Paenibacillus]MBP1157259.1 putative damage-inducible protein DinB [Paenibacillus sp. PvP091]MBP1172002.1 putative damage-inducible protein DinB [Paenibacillus sp. PvR098]MBP2438383.1 putative damage-inducible protein DinB [Paenibacillus sp. PvP052]